MRGRWTAATASPHCSSDLAVSTSSINRQPGLASHKHRVAFTGTRRRRSRSSGPVMDLPCGPSRNAASAATSSGSTRAQRAAASAGWRRGRGRPAWGCPSGPGDSTFTVMPRGASSCAHVRPMPISAALVAAYWLLPGDARGGAAAHQDDPAAVGHRRHQGVGQALAAATWTREHPGQRRRIQLAQEGGPLEPGGVHQGVRRAEPGHARPPATPAPTGPPAATGSPCPRRGSLRLSPVTVQPSASSRSAMALPMPELHAGDHRVRRCGSCVPAAAWWCPRTPTAGPRGRT